MDYAIVMAMPSSGGVFSELLSTPMDWEGLGSILGAVGTIGAILFAALSFKAQRRLEQQILAVADVRADALEIERGIAEVDREIDESLVSNRGMIIAEELAAMSGTSTPAELAAFLFEPGNFNIIVTGVYRGQARDERANAIRERMQRMIALADGNRLYFPVFSRAIAAALGSTNGTVRSLLDAGLVLNLFRNEDNAARLRGDVESAPSYAVAVGRIGDHFGQILSYFMREVGQSRFDFTELVVKRLARFAIDATERDLIRLIKNRRANERQFLARESDTYSGDVKVCLDIIGHALPREDRKEIENALSAFEGSLTPVTSTE